MHTNTLAIIRRATLKNSQRLSVRHCHPGKTGVWRLYKHSLADKHGRGFKAFQITDYHQISSCREALDKHLLLYSNAAHPRGQRLTLFASSGPAELTLNAPSWTDTPSSSAGCKDLIEPQMSLHLEVRTVSWHSDVAPSPTRQQHYDMSQKGRKKKPPHAYFTHAHPSVIYERRGGCTHTAAVCPSNGGGRSKEQLSCSFNGNE